MEAGLPYGQRLEGGQALFLCEARTCFLFDQPDIIWLWPLQVVYGKTDLEGKKKYIHLRFTVILPS